MRQAMRERLRRAGCDDGNAIIEFVFVAVIVMVPLIYLIAVFASVQRDQLAVTQAARDAGRAYATSDNPREASRRAEAAVRLAMADQGLDDAHPTVDYVAAGDSCDGTAVSPRLVPGAQFTVCVTLRGTLPGIPRILSGKGITQTGVYVVHIDDFRTVER